MHKLLGICFFSAIMMFFVLYTKCDSSKLCCLATALIFILRTHLDVRLEALILKNVALDSLATALA